MKKKSYIFSRILPLWIQDIDLGSCVSKYHAEYNISVRVPKEVGGRLYTPDELEEHILLQARLPDSESDISENEIELLVEDEMDV